MMEPKEYRQHRCPHGWVDSAQCEPCKTAAERDALRQRCAELERDAKAQDKRVVWLEDLARGRLEQVESDRKQALVWRDRVTELEAARDITAQTTEILLSAARDSAARAIAEIERLKAELAEAKIAFDRLTPRITAIIIEHDALKAELAALHDQRPVAWGWTTHEGIYDTICPDEHARHEGKYTVPLYMAPPGAKDEYYPSALSKTCENCEHWIKGRPYVSPNRCGNIEVLEMAHATADCIVDMVTDTDFSCNRWEAKV